MERAILGPVASPVAVEASVVAVRLAFSASHIFLLCLTTAASTITLGLVVLATTGTPTALLRQFGALLCLALDLSPPSASQWSDPQSRGLSLSRARSESTSSAYSARASPPCVCLREVCVAVALYLLHQVEKTESKVLNLLTGVKDKGFLVLAESL